jgi:ribosome-binding protein aMBF1 (putative translation factor)
MGEPPLACDKAYPRRCAECGKAEVRRTTIPYNAEVKHDGTLYAFHIPALQVDKCDACGEVLFTNVTDDQISYALREHLCLLTPKYIRDALMALGMRQKELGNRIGVAPETISRWISGTHIQSRAMDNLMRLFFAFNNVRSALNEPLPDPNLGIIDPSPKTPADVHTKGGEDTPPNRSVSAYAECVTFSRRFSPTVLRRKESFQLTPVLN